MNNVMLIQVTNQKAVQLLHDLEDLNLIKVLREHTNPPAVKLSEKYKGVFSKDDARDFDLHTQTMRGEWDNI